MKRILLPAVILFVSACGVTHEEHEDALNRAALAAAERDSLMAEVLATASLINQINVELADVQDSSLGLVVSDEAAMNQAAEENSVALSKIRAAITQLETSQAEIEKNRERIRALSGNESRLLAKITEFERTLGTVRASAEDRESRLESVIAEQRSQIEALAMQVDTMRTENSVLAHENATLIGSVEELVGEANTVYYIAGTKDELEKQGIVVNEGKKFLFFGSKTLQPARVLNPQDFTAIDKLSVREIGLPKSDKEYQILTRQNPGFLESSMENGRVKETLAIASPNDFWAPSKFLILVER